MVSTNDKKVKQAVRSHIIYMWKGNGGITGMVDDIEVLKDGPHSAPAVEEMIVGGTGAYIWNSDQILFLHKLGFTDDLRLQKYKWTGYRKHTYYGPSALYYYLMIRETDSIYNEYKKKHAPKKK